MQFDERRRFVATLMLITLVALTFRVIYTVTGTVRPDRYIYDSTFYRDEARSLATGHGFVQPGFMAPPKTHAPPVASHPPLLVVLLAPVSWASNGNELALRIFNCVMGALGVALIGLLGRELGGARTGVVAAVLAALYPNLWVNDGLIMAESLSVVVVAAAVLLALRVIRRPTLAGAAALGAMCGLGALTRGELVFLFPLLCLPALVVAGVRNHRRFVDLVLVASLVVVAFVGPWVAYNMRRFEKPVFISTNFDVNLLASSCPLVMHGRYIGGLWFCAGARLRGVDESVIAADDRKQAIALIRDQLGHYPVVVLARIGRTWSLFRPLDGISIGVNEGRPRWVTWLGLIGYYPLLVLAVAGAWIRRRRREVLWPMLVVPAIITAAMIASYGQVRYRATAEPMLVVLAAHRLTAGSLRDWCPRRKSRMPARDTPVSPANGLG